MNVLAIEAGGAQFGLSCVRAADKDTRFAFENCAVFASSEARSLSRDLTIQIDAVLSQAQWTTENLDTIAVAIGPGSWTSLRIALSTAKTLAQVCSCALCGVPSFDAWARAALETELETKNARPNHSYEDKARENILLLVVAPCRNDAIYGQIFNIEYSNQVADIRSEGNVEIASPLEWATRIAASNLENRAVMVCGEACETTLAALIAARQNAREIEVSLEDVARAVAHLGAIKAARGESDDAMTLQPWYIGVSNAERVLNERLANERNAAESVAAESVVSQSSTR